MSKVREYFERA